MKLKDYLVELNKLVKEKPEVLEMDVIYAGDDEGNWFCDVHNTPTLGVFEDSEFISENNEEDFEEYGVTKDDFNAICIN